MSREIYRVHGRCELYAGEDKFEVCLPACCPEALLYGVTRYVLYGVRVRHFLKEHHTEGVGQCQLRRPTSRDARVLLLSDPVGYDAFYSLGPLWFQLSASRALRYNR